MPATVDKVRTYLGIDPASTVDEDALGSAVAAANDFVDNVRHDWTTDTAGAPLDPWRPLAEQAAVTQAARWYGRRGSALGVPAFADLGIGILPRIDPDVRLMLELGEYQRSVIA
jgi:hypothetical protein